MVQQRARESLVQHGAVEQVELHREVHVQQVEASEEGYQHPPAGHGQSRTPAWWARVSEVLQRRVVGQCWSRCIQQALEGLLTTRMPRQLRFGIPSHLLLPIQANNIFLKTSGKP